MTDIPEGYALLINQIEKIMESINQDEPLKTLNETSLLLKTMDETFTQEHNLTPLQKKIDKILLDPDNNRLLRINTIIKREVETYIEYLDEDIGQDQRLYYHAPLEQDIQIINEETRRFLSLVIKHKLSDEITLN